MLSEKTLDNSRQLKRDVHQRRNGMEDLYGVCFTSNGDANNPATFYISLSPDYVYLERFAFKFVIKPYTSSVAGASGGGGASSPTSLEVDSEVENGTSTLTESIYPNPHIHSGGGGSTTLNYGVHKISTSSSSWRVRIDGIDITSYLEAQHGTSPLFTGEGIYPSQSLKSIHDFYDILEVCDVLTDEGRTAERDQILDPSLMKKVEVVSDAPFGVDLYLYVKLPHLNR